MPYVGPGLQHDLAEFTQKTHSLSLSFHTNQQQMHGFSTNLLDEVGQVQENGVPIAAALLLQEGERFFDGSRSHGRRLARKEATERADELSVLRRTKENRKQKTAFY
jgi:hypothetical protein